MNSLMRREVPGSMRIAMQIRLKHGLLWEIVQRRKISVKQLAKNSDVAYSTMINIIGLKFRPSEELALKIQNALGLMGEYLDIDAAWPQGFKGMRRDYTTRSIYAEVPVADLALMPAVAPLVDTESKLMLEAALEADLLDAREKLVVEMTLNGKTQAAIGRRMNRTGTTCGKILEGACDKLRSYITEGGSPDIIVPPGALEHTLASDGGESGYNKRQRLQADADSCKAKRVKEAATAVSVRVLQERLIVLKRGLHRAETEHIDNSHSRACERRQFRNLFSAASVKRREGLMAAWVEQERDELAQIDKCRKDMLLAQEVLKTKLEQACSE